MLLNSKSSMFKAGVVGVVSAVLCASAAGQAIQKRGDKVINRTRTLVPDQGTTAKGNLSFESLEHDFGIVKTLDKVQHTFTFTNAGSQPIEISNVRSSCGCTTAELDQRVFAPGESGEITAALQPSRDAMRRSTITLTFADTEIQPVRLRMAVQHEALIRPASAFVNFDQLEPGEEGEQMLVFQSKDPSAELVSIESPLKRLEIEPVEGPGEMLDEQKYPKQFRFLVRTTDRLPAGPISDSINAVFRLSDGTTESIPVRIRGIRLQDIATQPQFANLKDEDGDGVYTGRVRVFRRSNKPFAINEVNVGGGAQGEFTAKLVEDEEGSDTEGQWVEISGTPSLEAGVFRGIVTLQTDIQIKPVQFMFTGLKKRPTN